MKRQLIIVNLTIATVVASCNYFGQSVESTLDSEINNSFEAYEKIQSLQRDTIATLCAHLLPMPVDSTANVNIKKLNLSILQTTAYIDSLIVVMKSLNYKDINNVDLVKSFFFYKGYGDSLFNKLSSTFSIAEIVATDNQTKEKIINLEKELLRYSDLYKFKSTYFESTGSIASTAILYNFNEEVLRIGIETIVNIKN